MTRFYASLIFSVTIASFAQVLLKMSALKKHTSTIKEYFNAYVIVGYGMMVISTIATIFAYHGLDYKNGPVVESLGYIFIMILSLMFFHEPITKRKILGNALILIGVFVFYL
jgi:small multidrug resistance pump